ncbi:GPI mannosyltransferase 3 [Trichinella pseudospiralis]|uniref:Mannosyltransferase n=1 Tax=Trichinella pseudospiralis TaxID=6337 RepID=A0A0V1EML6_TRIPS|nr:GPI mannosyltransferase 3 [Trichinella pseudospiralis]
MTVHNYLIKWIVAYRTINCFVVQTWFVPDEYWQTLEPAHKLAFGYGYLTWEWANGLRTYFYPCIFAFLYSLVASAGLDNTIFFIYSPKLLTFLLSCFADWRLFKFVQLLYGDRVASSTLLLYWCNWFQFYCVPRTLLNSAELALVIIGLSYLPISDKHRFQLVSSDNYYHLAVSSIVFTLVTLIRPTSALIWVPLWINFLYRFDFVKLFLISFLVGIITLFFVSVIDFLCYGYFVIPIINFIHFNMWQGGSAFFGSHPWHWYITAGIPSTFFTLLIPISKGVKKCTSNLIILYVCALYVIAHSFIAHKEFRFVLPLIPLMSIYGGFYLSQIRYKLNLAFMILFISITNIPLALFASLLHQRGALTVMDLLRREASENQNMEMNIWFLMPCHSTPFYSHLHRPVEMRFLTCEPNLNNITNYISESDMFHKYPEIWIQSEMRNIRPTHLVLYENMYQRLQAILTEKGYTKCQKIFHTFFPISKRQSRWIVIARKEMLCYK